ncbi:translesion DNA synthesis-associated protein ImuA [Paraburkholderia phenoliruptrix]|uniref:translesion DNA synthesis-associated protein ImuA n=1 Tax=Paraburkholderia phenoliruptrix TaxID=252970 RepID=UPI002869A1D8|nr:translesion DNA synthesis-associated protein ImuA [Paraburkholderia phenoliruptrix]WMY07072.1 translesion DNA synthesis-associated protein ImuA [Paraburkholderia phenoliruptrix]
MAAAIQLVTTPLSSQLRRQMWQGNELAEVDTRVVPSGYTALDQVLPGKGWPAGSLTELLVEHWGAGELRLLARALCHLTKQAGRHVMLVAPPYQPCAAALKAWGVDVEQVLWVRSDEDKALWAATQALKQDGIGAVLVWLSNARADKVRRLQVAAQESTALAFLMRPVAAAAQSSPAPLRMICEPLLPANAETINRRQWLQDIGLSIDIFKRRGPPLAEPLRLVLPVQDALLPANGAESGQGLETQHVVDRRRIASLVAGSGKAADLASGWFVRKAESV